MTRVAAVDCGTNSIRLLVADVDPATGGLVELDRRMTIVRLGQGVDRTGRLAPEALERTFAACREYAGIIREHGVEGPSAGGAGRIRFVATSASRDAENRDEFVRGVAGILGVGPEVISGDQEAEFSFTGATRGLPGHEERLVVDIGGGSTEFVIGRGRVEAARSVDIGCVRLTERHMRGDPPAPREIAAVRADIEAALDLAGETVPIREAGTLIGLAGSVTTVAGIALGLDAYDSEAIHHSRVSRDRVAEITERLVRSTREERAAIPVIHPGRVDVITAGALVLLAVMDRAGVPEVVVSEHDILDGIAYSCATEAR
ncbi:Ppx/GppA phosphatase family protein [Streptomyces pacificus]|uniref:Ppx/GppA family phosphatase n=1 Tax=Streptomyces pacificus TaxID=2705029 RepID=A0A6A0AY91_9ACTN|nr:Ppx/GppA phosphatase family protein [Streptomyces pacificus]GFH37291.1 Ppx/GppA family phosphatase [Streptomyces pacificus]